MPKIKLKEHEKYNYEYWTTIKVRDINYGRHLGNDALVGLLHEARLDLFHSFGCNELDLGDGKTGIILGDLAVQFKSQGYMFDKITIGIRIAEIKNASFRIFYRIKKEENILALAETGIITFDYEENMISEIPGIFLEKLNSTFND